MTSSFFSRADMLKRQGRTARARRHAVDAPQFASSSSPSSSALRSNALNIIVEEEAEVEEEDERASSSSRSASPHRLLPAESSLKAKRRHANVSDIRIARSMPVHDPRDLAAALLTAPRPAPSPPSTTSSSSSTSYSSTATASPSPSPSPDSFELTFQFPQPPTSPSSILGYYACESPSSDGMPLTPATSDDEQHARPVQKMGMGMNVNPRRISIHPLVINKHSQRIFGGLEQQQKVVAEQQEQEEECDYSDAESDSEWYTREFSKIISLRSPVPAAFPHAHAAAARRDSLFFVDAHDDGDGDNATVKVKASRRMSKALPPTPEPRNSRVIIPSYPPPPVPVPVLVPAATAVARATASPVPSFSSDPSSTYSQNALRRAPPRFSVPADFEFTLEGEGEAQDDADVDADADVDVDDDEDDASSAFSFSMYDIDLGDADFTRPAPLADLAQSPSPRSSYSQPSFKGADDLDIRVGRIIGPGIPEEDEEEEEDAFSDQDVAFEMDYCMMLPLSLPSTPMDLEADIAHGLEQLRSSDNEEEEPTFAPADEEAMDTTTVETEQPQPQPAVPSLRSSDHIDDVFSPISPCFSPPPSSLQSSFIPYYSLDSPITDSYFPTSPNATQTQTQTKTQMHATTTNGMDTEERVLKSKWSSSTLGSIREEHERRGASSKLRLYFGGGGSKRASGTARSSKVPATPTSPFPSFMTPRKASKTAPSSSPLSPRNSAFPPFSSPSASASASASPFSTPFSTPSPKSSPSPSHAAYARAHPYSPSPKPQPRAHPTRAQQHGHRRGSSSDVPVIGYGNNGAGVRRRGSVSTISSDAGTEVSSSSTSSSGLRRKPIPVEMFLRGAA